MDNQLNIPASVASSLPSMVRNQLAKMNAQQQSEFLEEYNRKSKSSGIGYLSWLFLGWHYIYLRKWGWQVLFWVTGGGFLLWWFIDLFRVGGMVREWNNEVANEVMRNLKIFHS